MPSMLSLGVLALSLSVGDAKLQVAKPTLSGVVNKQMVNAGATPEFLAAIKGQKPIKTKSELMDRIREHAGARGRMAGECMDIMMDENALSSCAGATEDEINCSNGCEKEVNDLMSACSEPGDDTSTMGAGLMVFAGAMIAMACDPCMQNMMMMETVCPEDPDYDDMCGKGECADLISDLSSCDFSALEEMMAMMSSSSSMSSDSSSMSMGAALEMMSNMCSGCSAAMMAADGVDDETCSEWDGEEVSEGLCSDDCVAAYVTVDALCKDSDLQMFEMTEEDITEMRDGVAALTGACEAGGFEVPEPADMGAAPGASFLAALC